MELIRIYPKTHIKSNVSEVKVKISPKNYKKIKNENISYNMKVYFSPMLLNELSWSKENYIAVFKDAKNENNYVFKLADDDKGFKLNTNKSVHYLLFTVEKNIEKYNSTTKVEFQIDNSSLIVTL